MRGCLSLPEVSLVWFDLPLGRGLLVCLRGIVALWHHGWSGSGINIDQGTKETGTTEEWIGTLVGHQGPSRNLSYLSRCRKIVLGFWVLPYDVLPGSPCPEPPQSSPAQVSYHTSCPVTTTCHSLFTSQCHVPYLRVHVCFSAFIYHNLCACCKIRSYLSTPSAVFPKLLARRDQQFLRLCNPPSGLVLV